MSSPEYYKKIIGSLNTLNVEPARMKDLPTLIFMLPCFIIDEDTDILVSEIIDKLSSVYFVEHRDSLDLFSCSTLS